MVRASVANYFPFKLAETDAFWGGMFMVWGRLKQRFIDCVRKNSDWLCTSPCIANNIMHNSEAKLSAKCIFYHIYLSISPAIAVWFLKEFLVEESLTKFTCFSSAGRMHKNAESEENFYPLLVVVVKYADGYVNYTCFYASKFSTWAARKKWKILKVFCHLPCRLYTYAHIFIGEKRRYYMWVLTPVKNLIFHVLLSRFLLFPFRLWLCRTYENAKIRGERRSQYLVFCQTWSAHNRDISWKYY